MIIKKYGYVQNAQIEKIIAIFVLNVEQKSKWLKDVLSVQTAVTQVVRKKNKYNK